MRTNENFPFKMPRPAALSRSIFRDRKLKRENKMEKMKKKVQTTGKIHARVAETGAGIGKDHLSRAEAAKPSLCYSTRK